MKRRLSMLCWLILVVPVLAGCEGFDPQQLIPAIGGATAPAPTAPALVAATAVTPVAAAETPMLMCTPPACAPGESYTCPSGDCPGGCGTVCAAATPVSGPLGPAPTDWENLESWLGTAWLGNVDPAAVRAALGQSGMQRTLNDWRAADFDGDLRDEWVLVLYDQSMPGTVFGAAGDLWVVNDEGAIFRYYTAPSGDIFDFLAPTVVDMADLTGDGLPELITSVTTCGASTCSNSYRIVGMRDGQWVDRVAVAPPPNGSAAPDVPVIGMSFADARVADSDDDGLPEFLVHGGTMGSVGAGVVRPRTEVWRWDGAAITLAETIFDPTQYRHHILYEANDRMAAGDLDGALALYESAINDGFWRDDGFWHAPEQIRADINAFAAFRLILIDLLQGNTERANNRLAWLGATYPGSAMTGAASTLVGEWAGPEGAAALCDRIEGSLAAIENPTGTLVDMGYGNPSLGAGDFCP